MSSHLYYFSFSSKKKSAASLGVLFLHSYYPADASSRASVVSTFEHILPLKALCKKSYTRFRLLPRKLHLIQSSTINILVPSRLCRSIPTHLLFFSEFRTKHNSFIAYFLRNISFLPRERETEYSSVYIFVTLHSNLREELWTTTNGSGDRGKSTVVTTLQ